MTKLNLKVAKNGISLTTPTGMIVYQEHEDEKDSIEAFTHFLWLLNSEYGPQTNRYSEHRIQINIVQGDKFEDSKG